MVSLSSIESDITGLKVSRCNCETFDPTILYNELVRSRFDLCRLKVPSEDEYAVFRLQKMGLPFFFSGSIRKYRTKINDNLDIHYTHSRLSFETYNGTQDALLKDMLIRTWGKYPIGYYRSPFLDKLISKEQEIECVYQYYKKHNNNAHAPENKIMFMKDGDKHIGIFTLNVVGDTLECNLAGILPEYKSEGYFHDEMNFKKEYCIKHGLTYFTFGARNENAAVQKIFQHLNFQTIGSDNVFHIAPLLTHSMKTPITKTFDFSDANFNTVAATLQNEAIVAAQHSILPSANCHFSLLGYPSIVPGSKTEITFSFPVISEEEQLVTMQCLNYENPFTAYLSITK